MRLAVPFLSFLLLAGATGAAPAPGGGADEAPRPAPFAGSIAGKFLVAAPSMPDRRFARTVIYMCVHDENGAFGLIVNRRMALAPGTHVAMRLGIDAEATEDPVAVHWGGPVAPARGFVLHTADYVSASTVPVSGGMAFSVDPAAVADLVSGAGAAGALFALGYSGWSPGQLESELARDDWLVATADSAFVFDRAPETMWRAALERVELDL